MTVGIHPDDAFKISTYVEKYIKILEKNKIDYSILNANELDFWSRIAELDYFIFRWRHLDDDRQIAKDILPIIEVVYKKKVFPNLQTSWHFDDKIKQYFLMQAMNMPMIDSFVFYSKSSAIEWARESAIYPIVYKNRGGAGSQNVILINNKSDAISIINQAFSLKGISRIGVGTPGSVARLNVVKSVGLSVRNKLQALIGSERLEKDVNWLVTKNHVLFQEFLPENKYDTRVTVIGKRAFAYRRMNRENDFRSSGSGNFNVDPKMIDLTHIKIALEISYKLGFQSMAYDFLYDDKGDSKFCEISYTFVDWMVQSCPGYWDEHLNWNEGNFWPQYLQLVDLLSDDNLQQVEF